MANKLVIVESPAKARTLQGILGAGYLVKASLGHIRDLPEKSLGIDLKNFTPKYIVLPQKKKIIREIKEAANTAVAIYLATDPDREGEAISWHLVEAAKLSKDNIPIRRVVFHEVTEEAVKQAFLNPRGIDMDLVNAQQARRLLDRLVGYKLSPLLWRKVQQGLSAGRVQSAAVRMIVDREQEIKNFVPVEYWTIEVELTKEHPEFSFKALLISLIDGTKIDLSNGEEAERIVSELKIAEYTVKGIEAKEIIRQPALPFITSTLQQEAWRKLHFSAEKTMAIAQQLYEGLPIGGEGLVGLITYMRTDSPHMAASAVAEIRDFIRQQYGTDFLPLKPRSPVKKGRWTQEAHEAIRPTKVFRTPSQIAPYLTLEQLQLYELIWKRAVASQMSPATFDVKTITIEAKCSTVEKTYLLRASSSVLKFPGFTILYSESKDDDEMEKVVRSLPELEEGDSLKLLDVFPEQHFTQPPPRYTEATLIKALEQKGIGRPSTYAPILATIQERGYVYKENGRFYATELGFIVTKLLAQYFPKIIDLGFTAQMEAELDEIARGNKQWVTVLKHFYASFEKSLRKAFVEMAKVSLDQPTTEVCPDCHKPMIIKSGRYGKFLACSNYPECKRRMPFVLKTGISCPKCGKELVERLTRKKRTFYGCSAFPKCRFAISQKPFPQPCPQCGKLLVYYRKNWVKCLECKYKKRQ